jgi:hypothetical protein
MGKTRPPYPQQFREQAVRLVWDSEKTNINQIADHVRLVY